MNITNMQILIEKMINKFGESRKMKFTYQSKNILKKIIGLPNKKDILVKVYAGYFFYRGSLYINYYDYYIAIDLDSKIELESVLEDLIKKNNEEEMLKDNIRKLEYIFKE